MLICFLVLVIFILRIRSYFNLCFDIELFSRLGSGEYGFENLGFEVL